MEECPMCKGCGKVASDDEKTPWSDWLALPLRNSAAALLRLVKPIPCPRCRGLGGIRTECTHDKAYDHNVLLSDPPKRRWICRKCGEHGVERMGPLYLKETYDDAVKRFEKKGDE